MMRLVLSFFVAALTAAPLAAQTPAPPPAAAAVDVKPNDYADQSTWLCRPGRKGDVCDVDLTATVQKQLVAAYILGATFPVVKGCDSGGALKNIPLCRKPGQTGCVVNFSAFRSTVPPPANTLFGRAADPAQAGSCTNPAALSSSAEAPLHPYFVTTGRLIAMGGGPQSWVSGKTIDTPFVSLPGFVAARCATNEHATYLEVTVAGHPSDPRTDDIPGDLGAVGKPMPMWGLHLVDVNLVMGNLLSLVGEQTKT